MNLTPSDIFYDYMGLGTSLAGKGLLCIFIVSLFVCHLFFLFNLYKILK